MMPVPVSRYLPTSPLPRPSASTGADTSATELNTLQWLCELPVQVCFVEQASYGHAQDRLADHEVDSKRILTDMVD
jgi:hypothetical protein